VKLSNSRVGGWGSTTWRSLDYVLSCWSQTGYNVACNTTQTWMLPFRLLMVSVSGTVIWCCTWVSSDVFWYVYFPRWFFIAGLLYTLWFWKQFRIPAVCLDLKFWTARQVTTVAVLWYFAVSAGSLSQQSNWSQYIWFGALAVFQMRSRPTQPCISRVGCGRSLRTTCTSTDKTGATKIWSSMGLTIQCVSVINGKVLQPPHFFLADVDLCCVHFGLRCARWIFWAPLGEDCA